MGDNKSATANDSPPVKFKSGKRKITIVGAGRVGIAVAFTIMCKHISSDINIVDKDANLLRGEIMDLQQGVFFVHGPKISGSTDLKISANSKIIIITTSAKQEEGESRIDLAKRNAVIIKEIIPEVAELSPKGIILIVTNPVDVLAYIAWKVSGFPKHRVFGTGTYLDTARFRLLLSDQFGVAEKNIHGYILGEHGYTSVPIWSSCHLASTRINEVNKDFDPNQEACQKMHKEIISSGDKVRKLKGYGNWAIGLATAAICHHILSNNAAVIPLSTIVPKGMFGIEQELFLSIPCVVGGNGIVKVLNATLSPEEEKKMKASADDIADQLSQIGI